MRAPHGSLLVSLCLSLSALAGCTWGSKNGVPWWGTKKEKEEAAANLKKYGPVAFERIRMIQEEGKFAAKGGAAEKDKVATHLAEQIRTEQDPLVRIQIIRTLAIIPNETAADVLKVGMKDPDPDVRVAVCEGWGVRAAGMQRLPSGAPVQPREADLAARLLAEALTGDTNVDVRLAAARSLGKVKNDPRAVGALGIALKDADPALQFRAVASLKEVSNKDFGNDIEKWQQYVDSVAPASQQPGSQPPSAIAGRPQKTQQ
jgi:HEAT repeat protein